MVAILWHRRDLRVKDNHALTRASQEHELVIPVFVIDPFFFREERETCNDRIHFMIECLEDLNKQYQKLNSSLVILHGDTLKTLQKIQSEHSAEVYYNYDTNMPFGFERDAKAKQLKGFKGFTNDGIIREDYERVNWKDNVERYMTSPPYKPKKLPPHKIESTYNLQDLKDTYPKEKIDVPKGGRSAAVKRLKEFYETIPLYAKSISKPIAAEKYCSRLSAHLSFGCISVREIFQVIHKKDPRRFFSTRLHWNQHFTQKLQDFPDLPTRTVNPYFEKKLSSSLQTR